MSARLLYVVILQDRSHLDRLPAATNPLAYHTKPQTTHDPVGRRERESSVAEEEADLEQ